MQYRSLKSKPFKTIRKTILKTLNNRIQQTVPEAAKSGLRIYFAKGETGGKVAKLFTETGVLEIPDAKDCDNTDIVSRFSGKFVVV